MQDPAGASLSIDHDQAPAAASRVSSTRVLWLPVVAIAVITLLLDQVSKAWALAALPPGQSRPLIGDLISLTLIRNSGAAFSIGNQATWVMTLVALVITAVVIAAARQVRNLPWAIALGLLLGGSLGNLIDRFFREPGFLHGHVVDFLDYFGLFVGNVADIAIVVAAPLVAWLLWRGWSPSTPPGGPGQHPREAMTGAGSTSEDRRG